MADDDQGGQDQGGGGLRKQLEAALDEIKALKEQVVDGSGAKKELAFLKAGIDTSKGVGKLLAKTYDGPLDAEDIQAFAQEYGIDGTGGNVSAEDAEAEATQGRMDALRQNSRPDASGQRLSHQDWLKLSQSDPAAARQAFEGGQVEFPPQMAQQLAENRQVTRLGG